jgi:hypothetical protein
MRRMTLDCQYPLPHALHITSAVPPLPSHVCCCLDILDLTGIPLVDEWSIGCCSSDWLCASSSSKTATIANSLSAARSRRHSCVSSFVHQMCLQYHLTSAFEDTWPCSKVRWSTSVVHRREDLSEHSARNLDRHWKAPNCCRSLATRPSTECVMFSDLTSRR